MWIVEDKISYEITGVNLHTNKNGEHEIWATKKDGTTKLIRRSKELKEITEIKEAIDYSHKVGERTLELK